MRLRKKKILTSIFVILIFITFIFPLIAKAEEGDIIETQSISSVGYCTHIQDIGWEKNFSKQNGETAGTAGKSKRLEAIKIQAENLSENAKIKYQVHIQNIGWQGWKENGAIAGTEGKGLRLEAIRIKLENEEKY